MITLSIDVTKLDQGKFIKGKKGGRYANLILIETPNSDYGDYMVKQDVTKEERESGVQMPILGNAKNWQKREPFSAQPPAKTYSPAPQDDSEIPF